MPRLVEICQGGLINPKGHSEGRRAETYTGTSQDYDVARFLQQVHCVVKSVVLRELLSPGQLLNNAQFEKFVVVGIFKVFEKGGRTDAECGNQLLCRD